MSVPVRHSPYGRPAAALLHAGIADAKRDDPLRPVSVLVPTNAVGVSARRLLASGQLGALTSAGAGVAGLSLLTVYRLAELLGAPRLAAAGRRPVSTPVLAAAVRRALADAPGGFAAVAGHPATEAALVRAHRELREVSEQGLARLATRPSTADVVRLHRMVREALATAWYDETDLMAAATAAARDASPVLTDLGAIIVYLPQSLTHSAAALVRALAAAAPVEVIAGATGVVGADRDVSRSLGRLGVAPAAAAVATPPPVTRVVSVSDADEEARAAVRTVLAGLRDGVPLERMALLYPQPEPYARLLHEHLSAAGIAYNGHAVRPLSDRVLGRWLLDVVALPERGYRRQDVLGLIGAAPVSGPGDGPGGGVGGRVPSGRWERISREAGVARGRGDWDDRLRRFAERQRAAADREAGADEPRSGMVAGLRRDADDAEALRRFVLALSRRVEDGRSRRSWSALAGWARGLVEHYLGGERERAGWPQVERDAGDRVEAALDRLAVLDAVEADPTPAAFRRTLELELDDDLGRVGRLGEGVLVGRLGAGLGVDLDLIVVLGLAEGVLPSHPREDSLLPDAERALVADELPPRTERTATEHRHLLAALAASGGGRVLTYPRGDLRRSVDRPPSRWLLDAVEQLPGGEPTGDRRRLPALAPWLEHVESFTGGIRRLRLPATRQEYALHRLLTEHAGGRRLRAHPLVAGDPVLRRGVDLVRARRSDRFTRFDGNLSALRERIPSPTQVVVSPTRLEAWTACPLAYLVEHVLGVRVTDDPEELLEISPRDRGELVHAVLEGWLSEMLRGPVPDPSQPWTDAARARLRQIGERCCDEYRARGLTGHPLLWGRDRARILLDLERFCAEDDRRRAATATRPLAVEVAFGLPTDAGAGPVDVHLRDGRRVALRGRMDRIDTAGTRLLVTDYKTGGWTDYKGLSEQDPDLGGRRLQLPVYALAARAHVGGWDAPTRAEYWFVSTKGEFKTAGYTLTPAVLERFAAVLDVVVRGIEQGVFPAHPKEPRWSRYVECPVCDPDGLGTADRWRDWERKRLDPALAEYLALAEPPTAGAAPGDEAA